MSIYPSSENPLVHINAAVAFVPANVEGNPVMVLREAVSNRRVKTWTIEGDKQEVFTTASAVAVVNSSDASRDTAPEPLILLEDVLTRYPGLGVDESEISRWIKDDLLWTFQRNGNSYTTLDSLQVAQDLAN